MSEKTGAKPSKNLSRKEILSPPKFEIYFSRAFQWFYQHKLKWLVGALAAVAISLGTLEWYSTQQEALRADYFKLNQFLQTAPTAASALEQMEQFTTQHANTKEAYLMQYQMALLVKLSNMPQAIKRLESLHETMPDDLPLYSIVAFQLATLYQDAETEGQAKAIQLLQTLKTDWEDLRLLELARTYMLQNNNALAKAELENLIVNYPNSRLRPQAERLLRLL